VARTTATRFKIAAIVVVLFTALLYASAGNGSAAGARHLKIALSNSYIGNQWRVEMENLLKAYLRQTYSKDVDLTINNAGTEVQNQIAAIDNMISQHVDAILVNPASESALNPVVEQAVKRGIVVVDFDHRLSAPDAYKVGVDFKHFGAVMAQWLVKDALHGSGDIILNRGVPGFEGDIDEYNGAMGVIRKYPGIHVVTEVYGKWDETVSQEEMTKALTAHSQVNGVLNQAGAYGVVQAFLNLHHPFVPMTGEGSNGWRTAMLKYKGQGLKGISVGDQPSLSAYALKVAVEILTKQKQFASKDIWVEPAVVTTDQLKPGVNVFPNLPPTVYVDLEIPGSGINLTVQDGLKG
jgi:ribose transport system substrate-binding protein